ncbi:MAG: hypothetical protein ACXWNZ_10860 [Vulcanimicrobiaceae bacterium]
MFDAVVEARKIVHAKRERAAVDADCFTTFFSDGITFEGYRGGVYELHNGVRFELRRGRRLICHIHASGELARLVREINPGRAFTFYVRQDDDPAHENFGFVLTGLEPKPL